MECKVVAGGKELLSGHETNSGFASDGCGDKRVVPDQFKAKAAGALGDLKADPAESEDAEGLAPEFDARDVFLFPAAGMHGDVGLGQLTRKARA